jgi:hypothetical protein
MGEVHLLLDSAEAEAIVSFAAGIEEYLKDDHPFNTGTCKIDEQVAQQTEQRKRWAVDDMADILWDAIDDMRDRHPDDPALKDWAQKAVDLAVGVHR